MKAKLVGSGYTGQIPNKGQAFMVPGGSVIYIRVDPYMWEPRSPRTYDPENEIVGMNLENGELRVIPVSTTKRQGFRVLEPAGGVLEFNKVFNS